MGIELQCDHVAYAQRGQKKKSTLRFKVRVCILILIQGQNGTLKIVISRKISKITPFSRPQNFTPCVTINSRDDTQEGTIQNTEFWSFFASKNEVSELSNMLLCCYIRAEKHTRALNFEIDFFLEATVFICNMVIL